MNKMYFDDKNGNHICETIGYLRNRATNELHEPGERRWNKLIATEMLFVPTSFGLEQMTALLNQ
jgi:hypothetical protein